MKCFTYFLFCVNFRLLFLHMVIFTHLFVLQTNITFAKILQLLSRLLIKIKKINRLDMDKIYSRICAKRDIQKNCGSVRKRVYY